MTSKSPNTEIHSEESALLQYESLRSKALNQQGAFCQRSLGQALFVRRGMLAWIKVCRQCIPANPDPDKRRDKPVLAYETTSELIKVMANITLINLEGVVL